jgi:hypothetical protein
MSALLASRLRVRREGAKLELELGLLPPAAELAHYRRQASKRPPPVLAGRNHERKTNKSAEARPPAGESRPRYYGRRWGQAAATDGRRRAEWAALDGEGADEDGGAPPADVIS